MIWLYRKMLLIACLLAFGLVAPMVIFYAIGYRLGKQAQLPSPVGAVAVESIPRRATVEVNGQTIGRTPRTISGLLPGTASVAVHLAGYLPWEKTVAITPRLVTELRAIRLWPAAPARQIISRTVGRYAISPSRRLLAAQVGPQRLAVYDETGEVVVGPLTVGVAMADITFSADNVYVLLTDTAGRAQVLDVANPAAGLKPLTIQPGSQLIWDPRIAARLFVLESTGELAVVNVVTNVQTSVAEDIALIAPSNRYLYAVARAGQLKVYGLAGEELRTLAVPSDFVIDQLLVASNDNLALLLTDGRLAISLDQEEWQVVAEGVQAAGWSPQGQMIWVQLNPNELAVVNIDNERLTHIPLGKVHVVTRLSRPITHPQWFAGGQHLVYQVDDQLIISEIDTRDYPVSYTVDSTNRSDARAVVGEEGAAMYYLKDNGGRTHLVMTQLVIEQ